VLFYSLFYLFLNREVLNFSEKQSIKLVDEAVSGNTEYSKETLEFIKRRVSFEGIFTLYDEANSITESIKFENSDLKKQLELNKNKIEVLLKQKVN